MSVVPGPAPAAMEPGLLPWRPAEQVVARRYRPRDATVRRSLAAADMAAVVTAFAVVLGPLTATWGHAAWSLLALPGWTVLFKAYGLYEGDIKRFTRGVLQDLPDVVHAALVGSLLFWLYTKVTPLPVVDIGTLLGFAVVAATGILTLRAVVRRIVRRTLGPERALIIGDSLSIPLLTRKLRLHREYGIEVAGVVGG